MEKRTTIFSIFVFLCLLTNSTYARTTEYENPRDTILDMMLYFDLKARQADKDYQGNGKTLATLDSLLAHPARSRHLYSIILVSPDSYNGKKEPDIAPGLKRSEEVKAFLCRKYPQVNGKYSINSLVYWVTYVHNVVYSFYRSMIYCYINSTQRCAGSIVIDIIPTNGADKRKFFPFAPYFPVTNVIKRYFYPYFPAIIGIKGYSFPYFPYLSGIMKIKTALYSLFSRLDWHKTVVFPCLGEIYEGIRSLSWEIPVT